MGYIGIDIGDGETAASIMDKVSGEPRKLLIGTQTSVISAVGYKNDLLVIGDEAKNSSNTKNLQIRFKSRFLTENSAEKTICAFASGLLDIINKTNALPKNEPNYISIGCPSGWNESDRKRYYSVMKAAGFENFKIVSESRAAFLYAHYCEKKLTKEQLSQPALVIDIGSSTTDFAYILNGRETGVGVFGNVYLGGGLLDKYILEYMAEHSAQSKKLVDIFSDPQLSAWRNYAEMKVRGLKELFFTENKAVSANVTICPDIKNIISLNITLDGKIMDKILEKKLPELDGKCFTEAYESSLEDAKKYTAEGGNLPPEIIILTGGASRMEFISRITRKVFPKAQIVECGDPSHSIAMGLGIASEVDYRLKCFTDAIDEFLETGNLEKEIERKLPELKLRLIPVLTEHILDKCISPVMLEVQDRINRKDPMSDAEIQDSIRQKVENEFCEARPSENIGAVIRSWIRAQLTASQEDINDICGKYRVSLAQMCIADIKVNINMEKIRVPVVVKLFSIRLFNIIMPMFRIFPGTSNFTRTVKENLAKEFSDPKSELIESINEGVKKSVIAEVRRIAEEVEIHIS